MLLSGLQCWSAEGLLTCQLACGWLLSAGHAACHHHVLTRGVRHLRAKGHNKLVTTFEAGETRFMRVETLAQLLADSSIDTLRLHFKVSITG